MAMTKSNMLVVHISYLQKKDILTITHITNPVMCFTRLLCFKSDIMLQSADSDRVYNISA